jgi:hypothetical protein
MPLWTTGVADFFSYAMIIGRMPLNMKKIIPDGTAGLAKDG